MDRLVTKLEKARWWVLTHQPFYGQLTMHLADRFGPVGTACVDGKHITWEREWLAGLTDPETRYVLLHETLHCAHHHLWRLPPDKIGNIAGDYAIELILRAIPGIDQPNDGLVCPPDYESLAEEEIYKRLRAKKQPPQNSNDSQESEESEESESNSQDSGESEDSQGSVVPDDDFQDDSADEPKDSQGSDESLDDSGDSGDTQDSEDSEDSEDSDGSESDSEDLQDSLDDSQDHDDSESDTQDSEDSESDTDACGSFSAPAIDEDNSDLKDSWDGAIVQASQVIALSRGETPSDMARSLARIRTTPLNWRNELAEFVRSSAQGRNDWSRSARRHAWQPVIYPRRNPDIPLIVIAIDTSGSIDNELCSEFLDSAQQCCAEIQCEVIRIDCDAMIQSETRLNPCDEWTHETQGGGGTSFLPVFDRLNGLLESGEKIGGLIYFTDLEGAFPDSQDWQEPIPTLWAFVGRTGFAPFGRIVGLK